MRIERPGGWFIARPIDGARIGRRAIARPIDGIRLQRRVMALGPDYRDAPRGGTARTGDQGYPGGAAP
ncbi:MAG TPA: hypothetical protein VLM11_14595 [Streptosporangiaceae bacterium]|nr:hypothetical protein [Streptosporangiaceae bacterium]